MAGTLEVNMNLKKKNVNNERKGFFFFALALTKKQLTFLNILFPEVEIEKIKILLLN